ncbi:uncharacterized protein [Dermacentor albipictus]|uniref:uncharacterized protein isoform X1 n=1 Tax=Dermacentor albipictus TaxID=60249 RepID=UPI0038FCC7CF
MLRRRRSFRTWFVFRVRLACDASSPTECSFAMRQQCSHAAYCFACEGHELRKLLQKGNSVDGRISPLCGQRDAIAKHKAVARSRRAPRTRPLAFLKLSASLLNWLPKTVRRRTEMILPAPKQDDARRRNAACHENQHGRPPANRAPFAAAHSRSQAVKQVWERSRSRRAMYPVAEMFSDAALAQVAARRAVILCDHGSILLQMTGFCERQNVRTFVVASQPIEQSPFGNLFSRSLDERFFRKLFDKFRRIQETGLMAKWLADAKGNWQRCIQSGDITVDSISVEDTVPFFLLWGIMCAMAFCALLCELICYRLLRSRPANRR